MIDFHLHLGNFYRLDYPRILPLTAEALVDKMDREGIDLGVLLPLESPEVGGYMLTEQAVAARDLYPDRFLAFCCVDPRFPRALEFIDYAVTHWGCVGFGEHLNGLALDDPKNMALYAKCAEHNLPVLFDMNADACWDDPGLPRLERCLQQFPTVPFLGHGPRFWQALSGDDEGCCVLYPPGPVAPGGAVDRLATAYDNLWLDLSARSGYNALTRDPDYAAGFVARHWKKMLLGTDYYAPHHPMLQVQWLRELNVSEEIREAIGAGNARRLLGLD
jgi:predicted TIM-barrel fold metal-dependent hydrolase